MEEEEEELKASGNAAFKKGAFASAVDFFSRAIDASSKKKKNIENHHVLYSNRSAARVRRIIIVFLFMFLGERFFLVVDRMRKTLASLSEGLWSCRSVWTLLSSKKVEKNVVPFSGGIKTSSSVSGGGAREEEEEEENFSKG